LSLSNSLTTTISYGKDRSCHIYGASTSLAISSALRIVHHRHSQQLTRMILLSPTWYLISSLSRIKRSLVLSSHRSHPEVWSHCLFLKISKEVWDKLDSLYAVQSRSSAMQLHMQLVTLKKQDLSSTIT
jgi:hypothetical protein